MNVTIVFTDTQVSELFNLLDAHKDEHPELHEHVYQAMTKELFGRVNGTR